MYIVDLLLDVMFKKACVECVIKFFYRPGIYQTRVPCHWRYYVMLREAYYPILIYINLKG